MPDDVQHSAGGIVLHQGSLLLIEARRTKRWQLPKGHLERGETPQQAAVREVREETGALVTVIEPAGNVEYRFRGPRGRWIFKHVDFYLCSFARQVTQRCDPLEVRRAEWHPFDQALELLAFANERELVRATLDRLGHGTADRRATASPMRPIDVPGCEAGSPPDAPDATDRQHRGDRDGPEEIP